MSALITKCDLVELSDPQSGFLSLFISIYCTMQLRDAEVVNLKSEITSNRIALDSLTKDLVEQTRSKDSFQRDFFSKFCLIVNSKKDEIRMLCGEVNRLKEEVSTLQSTLSVQNLPGMTEAQPEVIKTKKAVPRKTKASVSKGKVGVARKPSTRLRRALVEEEEEEEQEEEEEEAPSPTEAKKRGKRHGKLIEDEEEEEEEGGGEEVVPRHNKERARRGRSVTEGMSGQICMSQHHNPPPLHSTPLPPLLLHSTLLHVTFR
jgi:hypothetical protein